MPSGVGEEAPTIPSETQLSPTRCSGLLSLQVRRGKVLLRVRAGEPRLGGRHENTGKRVPDPGHAAGAAAEAGPPVPAEALVPHPAGHAYRGHPGFPGCAGLAGGTPWARALVLRFLLCEVKAAQLCVLLVCGRKTPGTSKNHSFIVGVYPKRKACPLRRGSSPWWPSGPLSTERRPLPWQPPRWTKASVSGGRP